MRLELVALRLTFLLHLVEETLIILERLAEAFLTLPRLHQELPRIIVIIHMDTLHTLDPFLEVLKQEGRQSFRQ